jgi:hypothetical protein
MLTCDICFAIGIYMNSYYMSTEGVTYENLALDDLGCTIFYLTPIQYNCT